MVVGYHVPPALNPAARAAFFMKSTANGRTPTYAFRVAFPIAGRQMAELTETPLIWQVWLDGQHAGIVVGESQDSTRARACEVFRASSRAILVLQFSPLSNEGNGNWFGSPYLSRGRSQRPRSSSIDSMIRFASATLVAVTMRNRDFSRRFADSLVSPL